MKKFIVLSHIGAEAMSQMSKKTPDEMKEGMEKWFSWKEKYEDQVIDMGAPLFGGVKLLPDGSTEKSNKEVAGYMMIQADNLNAAIELLKDSPLMEMTKGCDIEIHEAHSM